VEKRQFLYPSGAVGGIRSGMVSLLGEPILILSGVVPRATVNSAGTFGTADVPPEI
jgi:hypothetical protein